MSQTLKSVQDYQVNSFGEELQVPTTIATQKNGQIVGGIYEASAPTLSDGQFAREQLDVNANAKVTLATQIAGEDLTNDVQKVEQRFSYYHHVGTAGAVIGTVKSGAGFLHSVIINSVGTSALTVYDSVGTSATVIGIPSGTVEGGKTYDVSFSTGLTVGGTSATDVTVSYR
jgi:hypothetical protein